jgi:hypothetical protein
MATPPVINGSKFRRLRLLSYPMPTLPQMRIPAPKGGDEFEQITLAAVKMLWSNPNFQRNGRQGQAQDGVDLYGGDALGRHVGLFLRMFSGLILHDFQREDKLSGEYWRVVAACLNLTAKRQNWWAFRAPPLNLLQSP